MNKLNFVFAVAASFAAIPAAASTYIAVDSFNGVNGNGGFSYGYTNGTTLTGFDTHATDSSCALAVSSCLYSAAQGNIPQASFGGTYPTVLVPTDALVFHPGNSASLSTYGAFTAAAASTYTYTIDLASVGIDTTNGIGYQTFTSIGGVVTLGAHGILPTYTSATTLNGTLVLSAGQSFGVIIDDNGNYGGDSTGVKFTVSNIPEPATWALMLGGFTMVGFAARRRRTAVAA